MFSSRQSPIPKVTSETIKTYLPDHNQEFSRDLTGVISHSQDEEGELTEHDSGKIYFQAFHQRPSYPTQQIRDSKSRERGFQKSTESSRSRGGKSEKRLQVILDNFFKEGKIT